ncbi:MAG TPA: lipoate--protein ligase, partial [Acholeplasmataceae bacterium]|nr:lipoate--protein ligase [Acholeplasmataceae bacterium]
QMRFNIVKGIIEFIDITGDFFELKEDLKNLENAFLNQVWSYQNITKIINNLPIEDIILNASQADMLTLFKDAFLDT